MKSKHAIPEREAAVYKYLLGGGKNLAITRTLLDGELTSCIIYLNEKNDEETELVPLALLVNESLSEKLIFLNDENDEIEIENTIKK